MPKEAVHKSEREHVYNDLHKNDQPGDLGEAVSPHVDDVLFCFFLGTKRPTKDNKQFFSFVEKRLSICTQLTGPQCITADHMGVDTHLHCPRLYLLLTDSTSGKNI